MRVFAAVVELDGQRAGAHFVAGERVTHAAAVFGGDAKVVRFGFRVGAGVGIGPGAGAVVTTGAGSTVATSWQFQ